MPCATAFALSFNSAVACAVFSLTWSGLEGLVLQAMQPVSTIWPPLRTSASKTVFARMTVGCRFGVEGLIACCGYSMGGHARPCWFHPRKRAQPADCALLFASVNWLVYKMPAVRSMGRSRSLHDSIPAGRPGHHPR